jgi:hypothetical protein
MIGRFSGLDEPGMLHIAIRKIEAYMAAPRSRKPPDNVIKDIQAAKGKMHQRTIAKKYAVTVDQVRYYHRLLDASS